MINSYLSVEQSKREQQGIEARDIEASRQMDLNWAGKFDGLIGIEPDREKWSELGYRDGFLSGIGRHYDEKYQIELENEPF